MRLFLTRLGCFLGVRAGGLVQFKPYLFQLCDVLYGVLLHCGEAFLAADVDAFVGGKTGVWSMPNPVQPWVFRKQRRISSLKGAGET